MKNLYVRTIFSILVLLSISASAFATAVFRSAAGANPAAIQTTIDQFRADLGGVNNGVGGSFTTGRREINWEDVPDGINNNLAIYYNHPFFSPRGAVFSAIPDGAHTGLSSFSASYRATSGFPVRFGDINPTYPAIFQAFSGERLFTPNSAKIMEVTFFVPGTNIPATVSGFGAVFADVDLGQAFIDYYGTDGREIWTQIAPLADNGLSFVGATFGEDQRISRVVITTGTHRLSATNNDVFNSVDVVAMDDFIYGEPRAASFHSGDFDGDGMGDSAIYRPSTANWFIFNSGSNTVSIDTFGANGDVPIDGDFDGDSRADLAIFRPSNGEWYFKRSTNGTVFGARFGQTGDKPVVSDYDKDGKSDIAFWRPSNGNYFVLRSSTDFSTFYGYPFGSNGDIPVQSGAQ